MSSADQNKPGGKSGRRNRKAEQQRSQKPDHQQSPKADQQQEATQLIDAAIASIDTSPIGAVAAANTSSIGFQTIATAYSDYARKSFEEAQSFIEKLSGVRSLDKALEVQTEFAKQAYETFVVDSQRIRELYSEFARQTFKPSKAPPAAR